MRIINYKQFLAPLLAALMLASCHLVTGTRATMANEQQDNQKETFETYTLGRFLVDVSKLMPIASKEFVVNHVRVEELRWEDPQRHAQEREIEWEKRLERIKKIKRPDSVKELILENREFSSSEYWGKGVLYHVSDIRDKLVRWTVLQDLGSIGVVYEIEGTNDRLDKILEALTTVISAYKIKDSENDVRAVSGSSYSLLSGTISLPYKYSEKLYARFEGHPLNLKLEIEMQAVHKVSKTNLIERLNASLLAGFAPGVSIDKIRTTQRSVAGLTGDEVVMRGKDDTGAHLSFSWRFNGKKDSGTAPKITIDMEAEDGQLEEKLAVWDAILDSMQVIPQ